MKRIQLNPFRTNILDSPEDPITINKEVFWNFYLNILKVKGVEITAADIEFYIKTIMFEGQDKDLGKTYGYNAQYVHMMRKRLVDAGLLIKNDRGNYSLHKSILNMKHLTETDKVDIIQFVFPFKIDHEN